MNRYLAVLFLALAAASWVSPVRAEEGEESPPLVGPAPYYQLLGSGVIVNPSCLGGELGGGLLFIPFEGRGLVAGPHVTGLLAGGSGTTRFDLNTGVEAALYFANAIAPGLAFDVVFPSLVSPDLAAGSLHFRGESFLSVRFARFQQQGAWAVRAGLIYDSFYRWGGTLGLSLQFNGVPSVVRAFGL
jgi:hypothetical protein